MCRIVDCHVHLEEMKNLREAIRKAVDVGVVAVIAVGSDYASSRFALEVSERGGYSLKVYPALGIHPWRLNLEMVKETLKFIESNIDKAVGIGEVGLDYWYKEVRKNPEKKTFQREVFKALLNLARRHDKPVIIHSRGAWNDCVEMTIGAKVRKAVFHWFTDPDETLERLFDHGYFVSATPAAEYSKELRRVIKNAPLERILLETDSPVKYRGLEVEPADVVRSLKAVAELKGEEETTVAEKTTENAERIFNIKAH